MQDARNRTVILFSWAWRLAILALPWQTRWFLNAELGGWPWEQGRWSVYGSWIFLSVVICLGYFVSTRSSSLRLPAPLAENRNWKRLAAVVGGLALSSVLALLLTPDWKFVFPAVAQWWIQALLLGAFVWTMWRARISFHSLVLMFVLSLLPHAALGFWQYMIQFVSPMKWLGIAAQDPRNLGVSVVEAGVFRVLRMYGGFPHPNLFGSWLGFGAVLSVWLASHATTKIRAVLFSLVTALLSTALLLAFARGAWIATILGIAALSIQRAATRRVAPAAFQYAMVAVCATALFVGVVGFTQRHVLLARVQATERIEQKSLETRVRSLKDGWMLFRAHPIFGTGPNAELAALVRTRTREPAEPPHNTYLLFLVDFGLLGVAVLIYAIARGWSEVLHKVRVYHWLVFPLLILGLVDHAPLSFWAGQTLLATLVLLISKDP